jgi:hypothetical protein
MLTTTEGGIELRKELIEFLTEQSQSASLITEDGDKIAVYGDSSTVLKELLKLRNSGMKDIVIARRLRKIEKTIEHSVADGKGAIVFKLDKFGWLDPSKYGSLGETVKAHKKVIKSVAVYGSQMTMVPRGSLKNALEAVLNTLEHRARNTELGVKMRIIGDID